MTGASMSDAATGSGLQSSMDSIGHAAQTGDSNDATTPKFPGSINGDLGKWSPGVRASLYLDEFMSGWRTKAKQTSSGKIKARFRWNGKKVVSFKRPEPEKFVEETATVLQARTLRGDRADEIFSQIGSFEEYFSIILGLDETSHPYTFELMAMVQVVAGDAVMPAKHYFAVPRPEQFDARIAPLIDYPGHGSFPSGHATQAHALKTVLIGLLKQVDTGAANSKGRKKLIKKQAERIAWNRTVAGVHFPADNAAGKRLGEKIGGLLVDNIGTDGDYSGRLPMWNWLWKKVLAELAS